MSSYLHTVKDKGTVKLWGENRHSSESLQVSIVYSPVDLRFRLQI